MRGRRAAATRRTTARIYRSTSRGAIDASSTIDSHASARSIRASSVGRNGVSVSNAQRTLRGAPADPVDDRAGSRLEVEVRVGSAARVGCAYAWKSC
jgi:hypothetical protein